MKNRKLASQLSFLAALTLGATSGLRAQEPVTTDLTDEIVTQIDEAEVSGGTDVVEPSDLGELVSEGEAGVIDEPKIVECFPSGGVYYFGGSLGEFQPAVKETDDSVTLEINDHPEVIDGEDQGELPDDLVFKGDATEPEIADEMTDGDLGEMPVTHGGADQAAADDESANSEEEEIALDDVIFQCGWYHMAGSQPYFRSHVDISHVAPDGDSFAFAAEDAAEQDATSLGFDLSADAISHHAAHGHGRFFAHVKVNKDTLVDADTDSEAQAGENESTDDSSALTASHENSAIENIEPVIDVAEVPTAIEEEGRVFLK